MYPQAVFPIIDSTVLRHSEVEGTESGVTGEPNTSKNPHSRGFLFYNITFLKYNFGNGALGLENAGRVSKRKGDNCIIFFKNGLARQKLWEIRINSDCKDNN